MRESGNCRTTDGAPRALSSLRREKTADETNSAQKLFHYMPTLHSSSSFWRDGWQQGSLGDKSVRVWDFSWSEEEGIERDGRVESVALDRKEGASFLSGRHH